MCRLRVLVALFSLAAAGCGGESTALLPSSPSAVSSGSGATISGTVTGTSITARSITASPLSDAVLAVLDRLTFAVRVTASTGLSVTVIGTNITAAVDGSGRFVLENVPTGDVRLRISGVGVDAELLIQGVQRNEGITIQVNASGSVATINSTLRKTTNNRVELQGLVSQIAYPARTFRIGDTAVAVPDNAVIKHGQRTLLFSNLNNGDRVHVSGMASASGVSASEIALQQPASESGGPRGGDDEDDEDAELAEVVGVVSGLVNTCPSIQFTVNGTTVVASASTEFMDGGCGFVQNGLTVEATGTYQGSTLAASRVSIGQEVTLKGAPASVGGACPFRTFTVNGTLVTTIQATEFKHVSCAAFETATDVEVEGFRHADGHIVARKVESEIEEIELKGSISGLSGGCPTLTFFIGSRKFVTDGSTSFKPSCGAVANGAKAEVEGILQPDGSVRAKKVEVEEEEVEFKGTVSSLSPGCPNVTFFVGSRKVVTHGGTSFKPACGQIVNGAKVEGEGILQSDGSVRAKKVEVDD